MPGNEKEKQSGRISLYLEEKSRKAQVQGRSALFRRVLQRIFCIYLIDMIHEDALVESSILLLPEEMSYGIRQYCGDIMLIINRYAYRTYCNNGLESEFYELRKNLYEPL